MPLDLSSAFDTVDHNLLLKILEHRFSVTDSAHKWFSSYLSDRTQTIHINKSTSSIINVSCGMPQGSSLGPKTFIAYTEEINSVFADHRLDHHCFADDTQAYVATVPSQAHTIAPRVQHCIADVAAWCGARRLQLNPLKTEIMWFGSATALRNMLSSVRVVNVESDVVQPVSVVRDLGV